MSTPKANCSNFHLSSPKWIEDNIKSIISNKEDDLNESIPNSNQLNYNRNANNTKIYNDGESEIESCRTINEPYDVIFGSTRVLSPETIHVYPTSTQFNHIENNNLSLFDKSLSDYDNYYNFNETCENFKAYNKQDFYENNNENEPFNNNSFSSKRNKLNSVTQSVTMQHPFISSTNNNNEIKQKLFSKNPRICDNNTYLNTGSTMKTSLYPISNTINNTFSSFETAYENNECGGKNSCSDSLENFNSSNNYSLINFGFLKNNSINSFGLMTENKTKQEVNLTYKNQSIHLNFLQNKSKTTDTRSHIKSEYPILPINKPNKSNFYQNGNPYTSKKDMNNKLYKSTSTMFKENNKSNNFVSHSISSDNFNFIKTTNVMEHSVNNRFNKENNTNDIGSTFGDHYHQHQHHHVSSSPLSNQNSSNYKEQTILHVRNLDYKISSDEWKRILTENFKRHCREVVSVDVVTNADKSLLGIVKVGNKDDIRLAISSLHHKKIGYKRLNVNVAFSPNYNSPKSKIVALLKSSEAHEMPLTRFIELYETRYYQTIAVAELFKLRDIVHITHSKDGQGRLIKLAPRIQQNNLETEMRDLMHSPYCLLHSQDANGSNVNTSNINWLPNVIVSLRLFKPSVHKLLNDHGGQMPLLSFMDCYKACILNETSTFTNSRNNSNFNESHLNLTSPYRLIIDNENGVPLEHLATCAQDVIIKFNEGVFKQLQWENDKSKTVPQNRQQSNNSRKHFNDSNNRSYESDYNINELDESFEDSQRKQNQFSHEVVELFKGVPRCIIPLSKFNIEYHKKYGRQCRVADYGYTKLYELLESIPHILQILGSEYEKKLTLTHRVQVRRFSNDLTKVLKSHPFKQMFADEFPSAYEKYFNKVFDIRDYGVCFLEDMLAELPDSTISRKEIDGRTFIQIPKIVQMEEEKYCTEKLAFDIIDMLKYKPRFAVPFNRFIPNFHHHFGRQCKLSNYGFSKLMELLEAMPSTVQIFSKDGLQCVQLKKNIMLDLVCQNIAKIVEDHGYELQIHLLVLENFYNMRYEYLVYEDFDCNNIHELFAILPLDKHFIETKNVQTTDLFNIQTSEILFKIDSINERLLKRISKLILRTLMDGGDDILIQNKSVTFQYLINQLFSNEELATINGLNKRSKHFIVKQLSDYVIFDENELIIGFNDLYFVAKDVKDIFKRANVIDMSMQEVDSLYKQFGRNPFQVKQESHQNCSNNGIPYKKLGYVDIYLLFTQGLHLLVNIKKYNEKRVFLNKEFWRKPFVEATPTVISNSPQSPLNNNSKVSYSSNFTPIIHNATKGSPSSSLSSSSSGLKRNVLDALCNNYGTPSKQQHLDNDIIENNNNNNNNGEQ